MGALSPHTTTPPLPLQVLNKAALKAIGITLSNVTLCRMERTGRFPRRFYLSSKCPVWDVGEVSNWLAARRAEAAVPNLTTEKAARARRRVAAIGA